MCLGVPTMAALVADNQSEAAQQLSKAGLLYLLGPAVEVTEGTVARGLRTLLGDPALRQRMADGGQALVDGQGIDRIVDAMVALS
jgi:spore coat polysaccharide biosynthesis predicted glycosyltransferase SpsG